MLLSIASDSANKNKEEPTFDLYSFSRAFYIYIPYLDKDSSIQLGVLCVCKGSRRLPSVLLLCFFCFSKWSVCHHSNSPHFTVSKSKWEKAGWWKILFGIFAYMALSDRCITYELRKESIKKIEVPFNHCAISYCVLSKVTTQCIALCGSTGLAEGNKKQDQLPFYFNLRYRLSVLFLRI